MPIQFLFLSCVKEHQTWELEQENLAIPMFKTPRVVHMAVLHAETRSRKTVFGLSIHSTNARTESSRRNMVLYAKTFARTGRKVVFRSLSSRLKIDIHVMFLAKGFPDLPISIESDLKKKKKKLLISRRHKRLQSSHTQAPETKIGI